MERHVIRVFTRSALILTNDMLSTSSSIANTAPFGDCKNAVLRNTQAVQGHGALLAVDRHSQGVTACSDNGTVARHSGLDRVMCYRFLPGWHGAGVDHAVACDHRVR